MPDSQPSPAITSRWTRTDYALLSLVAVLSLYALLQLLLMRFGRDQGIYAVVADAVLRGGMPYRDAWDFKPPGIFILYTWARGLFGDNPWGIRLVEALGLASLFPAFALLAKRYLGDIRPGIVAAGVATLLHAQLEFWHTGQPESFAGFLTVWALVLGTDVLGTKDAPRSMMHASIRWLAAGALLGAAGLMKPHLVGAAAVLWLVGIRDLLRQRRPIAGYGLCTALLAVGGAIPIAACLAWFRLRGAYADFHEALFVFAPGYAQTTWDSHYLLAYIYQAIEEFAMRISSFMIFGWLLAAAFPKLSDREKEAYWVVGAVAFVHLVGIAIQSKFFPYHFGATIPLGAFVVGLGVWKAWQAACRKETIGWLVWGVSCALALYARPPARDLAGTFWERSYQRTHALLFESKQYRDALDGELYSVADVNYGANVAVARWIASNTSPEAPVFVWGFEPMIYDVAERKPATRYIYNVPQRVSWNAQQSRRQLLEDLQKTPPQVIVVERRDVFPVVTGNMLDSADSLAYYPEFDRYLHENYEYKTRIQDFDLYERLPPGEPHVRAQDVDPDDQVP